jgi:hypothetical protein
MSGKRVVIAAALVVVGTVLTAALTPRQGHGARAELRALSGGEQEPTQAIRGAICGFDRWPVKTLADPQARHLDLTPHPATVRYLGSLPANPGGQDSRSPLERRAFAVRALLVGVKRETDSDYHLILSEGGARMIAEMPLPACTRATAADRPAMTRARAVLDHAVGGPVGDAWIHLNLRVRVVGVLFFDFPHGQSGHAPNYAELHPVIGFSRTTAAVGRTARSRSRSAAPHSS